MPTPLFNRFGTNNYRNSTNNQRGNLFSQLLQLKNNPGGILDILLQNGKITQQQYTELQPYKNNPEAIGRYLINHGNVGEINKAQQIANNMS